MALDPSLHHSNNSSDAESRLLLVAAKPFFSNEQLDGIKSLATEINNWDHVANIAVRKFSATYLHRALTSCAEDIVPPKSMQRLGNFAKATRFQTLKIAAAQVKFHKECIEPLDVCHAYLKGIALSVQFDGNVVDRFCRDIDVLVHENDLENLMRRALDAGYRVVMTHEPMSYATSPNDIKFLMKYSSDISLIDTEGTLIEVHRRLDKKTSIFDSTDALSTSEIVQYAGTQMRTLNSALHFVYLCYHHSRHLWSHLHWLADLDLLIRSPKLDLKQVSNVANKLGIRPLVDASFDFHELLEQKEPWTHTENEQSLEKIYLNSCLSNLAGGLEIEYELKKGKFMHDFVSRTQLTPERVSDALKANWKNRFHPTPGQYLKRPLPPALFWLYRVQLALLMVRDAITKPFALQSSSASIEQNRNS